MKKILKYVLITFLVLCAVIVVIIGGILAFEYHMVSKGDPEGKAIADQWIPAIVSEWNADQLISHLGTNFTIDVTNTQGSATTQTFTVKDLTAARQVIDQGKAKFGSMKNYGGAKCVGMSFMSMCSALVQFEHGDATIGMGLTKQGNEQKIMMFSINPPKPAQ